jgi:hypothetical protein
MRTFGIAYGTSTKPSSSSPASGVFTFGANTVLMHGKAVRPSHEVARPVASSPASKCMAVTVW